MYCKEAGMFIFNYGSLQNGEIPSRRARPRMIDYLKSMEYPDSVIRFYQVSEPKEDTDINEIRIFTIRGLREMNNDYLPSSVFDLKRYLIIGDTANADAYCLDIRLMNAQGEPRVVLMSHDLLSYGMDEEQAVKAAVPVADSFDEFIARFQKGELPSDFWKAKDSLTS